MASLLDGRRTTSSTEPCAVGTVRRAPSMRHAVAAGEHQAALRRFARCRLIDSPIQEVRTLGRGARVGGSHRDRSGWRQWNRKKKTFENKMLKRWLDHNRVLFVQHPSENKLHRPVSERSVVVCARSFGNCDRATEGGIPRSSRLGLSLKSLAFSGCVRRREGVEAVI